MRTRIPIEAGALALGCLLSLGGCAVAPPPSQVERDYGLSHRLAIYSQTANPDAEENLEPVEGIDGKAALGIMSKYRTDYGYAPDMDASTFDMRPTPAGVSEIRIKDVSDGSRRGTAPTVNVTPLK